MPASTGKEQSNVIAALSPSAVLKKLPTFSHSYISAKATLGALFVFPNLESISVSDDPDASNLRELISEGNSRFSTLSLIDVKLAREVVAYGSTCKDVLESVWVSNFVEAMGPIAKSYADDNRSTTEQNVVFFDEFMQLTDKIKGRIPEMVKKLATLDSEIEVQSASLAGRNIVQTLLDILKTLFKLSDSPKETDAQIAALLNVGVDTIGGDFDKLFSDQARLEKVLKGLKNIRDQIATLQEDFTSLTGDLVEVISDSKSLLGSWDDLATRMETVKDVERDATSLERASVTSSWTNAAANAQTFINAIAGSSTPETYKGQLAAFLASQKVPQTPNEIRLYRLASKYGVSISNIPRILSQGGTGLATSSSDEKVIEGVLAPPTDTLQKLDNLATNSGLIIQEFDTLLKQPFVEQLSCTDPRDSTKTTTIFNMAAYYREKYLALQQDTIPVARDLVAYANVQQTLLPLVSLQSPPPEGSMTMQEYLAANKPLTEEYVQQATDLSRRTTEIKYEWDTAVGVVQKAINECNTKINSLKQTVEDMTSEQKKAILFAVLSGIGAIACFAAAAFIPGVGMLGALGPGGTLGGLSIAQIEKALKLNQVINDLKAGIKDATTTRDKLTKLLPFMQKIATSLSNISGIWSDIATALTKVDSFYRVLDSPSGPTLFNQLRPKIISEWKNVESAANKYIEIITGGKGKIILATS